MWCSIMAPALDIFQLILSIGVHLMKGYPFSFFSFLPHRVFLSFKSYDLWGLEVFVYLLYYRIASALPTKMKNGKWKMEDGKTETKRGKRGWG